MGDLGVGVGWEGTLKHYPPVQTKHGSNPPPAPPPTDPQASLAETIKPKIKTNIFDKVPTGENCKCDKNYKYDTWFMHPLFEFLFNWFAVSIVLTIIWIGKELYKIFTWHSFSHLEYLDCHNSQTTC